MSAARPILAGLAGLLLCAVAQAQELNTQFVSQSVPSAMTAGQSYPVSVTLKNTGTWGWGTTSGHFLGSQNPQNNTNWGLNRVPLPHFVGPTQNVTFSFQVTAPATAGTYNFQWRMVHPAAYGWFGATTPNVSVQVNVADAAFVSQSVPSTMVAGQSSSVSVTLQNTGGTTWAAGSVDLGSQNPQDNSTWGLNRVALPAPVAPGASATFNFSITAPSTPGTYNFQWRMLQGTNGWFGAPSTNVAVSVISGMPDANVFFIHIDHLNQPRLITNQAQQAVWRQDQAEPFGNNPPDENPAGVGVFEFPLRDEGTYADKETGLVYNVNRYRDIGIGRFPQADPLGLRGGDLSLYVLRRNNPLSFTDPLGLTVWMCTRKLDAAVPGNHTYLWDDTTNKCCGRVPGADPLRDCKEKGPGSDFCVRVAGSDGKESEMLKCCDARARRGAYVPFFNDCVNTAEDCIKQSGLKVPQGPTGGSRTGSCSSCFSTQDPPLPPVP